MVQIIRAINIKVVPCFQFLYIPHGSDNTAESKKIVICAECFISHMVQIIPFHSIQFSHTAGIFISHMVQIILYKHLQVSYVTTSLYPTWFR